MLTHYCADYLKVTNVQNVRHHTHFIVDNNMQQNGILITLLLVKQQHRKFQFHASGNAVFLIFWHTQCSLNHPTNR
jgi:hypothetical protein